MALQTSVGGARQGMGTTSKLHFDLLVLAIGTDLQCYLAGQRRHWGIRSVVTIGLPWYQILQVTERVRLRAMADVLLLTA